MMVLRRIFFLWAIFLSTTSACHAQHISNLKIKQFRAVGDYYNALYDNTLEIWFEEALVYPIDSLCTATYRVYVDSRHKHVITAAYMAFALGKRVDIHVDQGLPIRGGSCEISYLDVIN